MNEDITTYREKLKETEGRLGEGKLLKGEKKEDSEEPRKRI
jgi:hypothetical protein